ncbi:nucleolar complex protein 2 homolog [Hyalella azteca]|uniref:Nucleolar complex protein 2 homolog n=1 Tax=Hyalella azteca TaxID=294128 RepID=A0A8B7P7X6_HYAAZ|nr:nucleolar complex protein 2 homolog [Hyalella azteca]
MTADLSTQEQYLAQLKEEDPEFYRTIISAKGLLKLPDDFVDKELNAVPKPRKKFTKNEPQFGPLSDDEDDYEEEQISAANREKIAGDGGSEDEDEPEDVFEGEDSGDEEQPGDEVKPYQGKKTEVTTALVKKWKIALHKKKPDEAFRDVSEALLAAIESVDCSGSTTTKFIVKAPNIYNQLVHVALLDMVPALRQMLHVNNLSQMHTCKKYKRYVPTIRNFLQNLMKLFESITEPSLKEVILRRGVLPLISVYKDLPKQCKKFVKDLVEVWSSGHHKTRVLAFLGLLRIVRISEADIYDFTLKTMYLAYVQSCRFTSPSSLGVIWFMRVSLTELYSLNHALAYRHAFVYIRQMAFHLRNAIIANKKEKMQLVYNWQFVHCLHLWCTVLSHTHPSTVLEPLVYPVVQLAFGTMKLQESPRFFPLVLHICGMLTDLSAATSIFIPVLPHLINVITQLKGNKWNKEFPHRNKKEGEAPDYSPPNWRCALKLSEGELGKRVIARSLIEECLLQVTRYLAAEAHNIAFPELVVPATIMLKKYSQRKDSLCVGQVRQLLAKIKDHSELLDARRQNVDFQLKEVKKVRDWEITVKQEPNLPMIKYYENLMKRESDTSGKRKRDATAENEEDSECRGVGEVPEEDMKKPAKKPKIMKKKKTAVLTKKNKTASQSSKKNLKKKKRKSIDILADLK